MSQPLYIRTTTAWTGSLPGNIWRLWIVSLAITIAAGSAVPAPGQDAGIPRSPTQAEVADTYETTNPIRYRDLSGDQLPGDQLPGKQVPGKSKGDQCVLDVYWCNSAKPVPTIVWFHGGGLTGGNREIPQQLKQQRVNVVAVDYRLSPRVTVRDCIDDAAAAVAWTIENISQYNGRASNVFVSGHSAGGYLTSMIGLDKSYLEKYGVDADSLAGLIPLSGHTITHFTERKSRGIDGEQPIVDAMAPLFHVRKDCPPVLLITADRELEMLGRYEENAYLWRMFQVVGHSDCKLLELDGYDHGKMVEPALPLLLDFVAKSQK